MYTVYICISVFVAHTYQHVSENQLTTTRFFKVTSQPISDHFFCGALNTCFSIWGIISGHIWKKLGDFFFGWTLGWGDFFLIFLGRRRSARWAVRCNGNLREDRFQPIFLLVQWKHGCTYNHGPPKPIFLEVFYGK